MFAMRVFASLSLSVGLLATVGCGGRPPRSNSNCGVTGLNVTPSTATANHAAAAPGNSQTFIASLQFQNNPGSCPVPADLVLFNWTASDPSVHLSSSPTAEVIATCTAAVTNPVTIAATPGDGQNFTGRGTLTCN
jgi:hypothetical protein